MNNIFLILGKLSQLAGKLVQGDVDCTGNSSLTAAVADIQNNFVRGPGSCDLLEFFNRYLAWFDLFDIDNLTGRLAGKELAVPSLCSAA